MVLEGKTQDDREWERQFSLTLLGQPFSEAGDPPCHT